MDADDTAGGAPLDWDAAADTFDEAADHGLRDPVVRAAWAVRLRGWLPSAPADVADLGCGTGSLALLAAEQGHRVTALDAAPRMAARARAKLAGTGGRTLVGDAARPPPAAGRFDAVLVRHVLWTLPDPSAALRAWTRLLRPEGRLVLIEGCWGGEKPSGIELPVLEQLLAPIAPRVRADPLSGDATLWGRPVSDQRYALVAHPSPGAAPCPAVGGAAGGAGEAPGLA